MSTGTSLVHPHTAKLPPDQQAKGVYQYTPPEVLAYQRGEQLSEQDLAFVKRYYGGTLPSIPGAVGVAENVALAEQSAAPRRKLVKKGSGGAASASVYDAITLLVNTLGDNDKELLLMRLANDLGYEV
ncbi:hypothetical protein AXI70_gp12 [Cronobacter phage Dev-CD-23823]|uniref:Uncharacterized protein n=1 Tax=Cronobacter phage Dev-CD-23823 TaxID=1712539 RepID=A0A0K8IX49_9CAUD|nr:hypothetical protein AXI70_gp12 [Cronobacter phage Dev-CD-23823]CUH74587.1 hypothetical protein [Cronobacter phage Dev-CD-23823]